MVPRGSRHSYPICAGRLAVILPAFFLLPLLAAPQEKATSPPTAVKPPEKSLAEKPPAQPAEEPFLYENRPQQLQSAAPRWWACAISPDGKTLAVSAGNHEQTGEILIFDFPAGTLKATIKHAVGIRCVAFSPDGKTLAAGSFDNSLRLYDVATQRLKALGVGHTGAVNSVAFSSDGKVLVTGSLDNHVMVWQTPNVPVAAEEKPKPPEFKPYASLEEHTNWVLSVAISKDGKSIVSGGRDNLARVWDVPAPQNLGSAVIISKSRLVLKGHTAAVETVAISADGATIATGSWDGSARAWNAADGKVTQTFAGHPAGLTSLAFHKGGKELAVSCDPGPQGGEVRRYEVVGGKQLGVHYHGQSARCVIYTPDGENLVSLGEERMLNRIAVKDHKPLGQIRPPAAAIDTPQIILGVAYSPDGKQFAAAGENKKITIWSLPSKESRSWAAHDDIVSCLAYSPDSKTLVSGSYDKTIKVWDLAGWKPGTAAPPVRIIKAHTNWIFAVAFSHDGSKLASGSYDKTARLYDLANWKKLADLPPNRMLKSHSAGVRALAFSPDDKLLATAGADRTIRLWSTDKGDQLEIIRGHKGTVRAVAFAPDGKTLASGSEDKSVKLWELVAAADGTISHRERAELGPHSDMVAALAYSPKGRTLAAATWNGLIVLWDPDLAKRRIQLAGHADGVSTLAFPPDGQQFASGSYDRTVRFWPAQPAPTGSVLSYSGHADAVWGVALSSDGRWVATGSRDGAIRVYERYKSTPAFTITAAHSGGVTGVAISADNQTIASVGKDRMVRWWKAAGGQKLREAKGHSDEPTRVAFSPDGKTLATAGRDKNILIWDVASAKELKKLSGHTDVIEALAFSPDGKLLASAGLDRTYRVWDTAKWEVKHQSPQGANNGQFLALAFAPDGQTLALAHNQDQEIGPDGDIIRVQYRNVMFIDLATGKPKTNTSMFIHPDWITGMAYSTDGQTLITASRDMLIRFWSTKTGQTTRQFRAHNAGIADLAVARDDGLIATAGEDRQASLWSAVLSTQASRALLTAHVGQIWFAELSKDGKYLATGGDDKRVQLRDRFTGTQPFAFTGEFRAVYSVAASADGRLIASGHHDGKIEIWEASSGKKLTTLAGHTMRVWGLAFTPDGKQLVSCAGDWDNKDKPGEVKQWIVESGNTVQGLVLKAKVVKEFAGHTAAVFGVALSPDGKTLATASHDTTARLWSLESGKLLHKLQHKHGVRSVGFAPDGKTLVAAENADLILIGSSVKPEGTLVFWDVNEGREKARHKLGDNIVVNRARYSPDGKTIAVAGNEPRSPAMPAPPISAAAVVPPTVAAGPQAGGRLLLWDVETAKVRKEGVPVLPEMMLDVAFDTTGTTVVTVGGVYGQIGNVRFWDAASGGRVGELYGHQLWCEAVAVLGNGRVVSGGGTHDKNGELKIWNAGGIRPAKGLDGHTNVVAAAAFSPDMKQLATGGVDNTVFLWDISAWPPKGTVEKRQLKGHTGQIRSLKYSPDGAVLVSSCEDGKVRFWNPKTGELTRTIEVSNKPVYSLAISSDGKWLATAVGKWQETTTGEVKIWNMKDGTLVTELKGFVRHVWNVAFSPDDKLLVAAGGQATVRIFETGKWTEKAKLPVPAGVRAMAISPDGKTIATASETNNDPMIRLWDVDTGRERAALQGTPGLIFNLRFTPDGKTLLGCGANVQVQVWDVPMPKTTIAQK